MSKCSSLRSHELGTPGSSDAGAHTIEVKVDDGAGGIATLVYSLNVTTSLNNRLPVFTTQPGLIATENALYQYTVAAQDPDGHSITLELADGPEGMTFNATTGVLRWTPATEDLGVHVVRLRAYDSLGGSSWQTYLIDVRPVNGNPWFETDPITTATVDLPYRYDVDANDNDDAITYSLIAPPTNMTIDPRTGLIWWVPDSGDLGPNTITVRATDERGGIREQIYTLTVTEDEEDPSVTLVLSEEVVDINDLVTAKIYANDNVAIDTIALEINGSPATLNGQNEASFTPLAAGFYTFTATVEDDAGNITVVTKRLKVIDPTDVTAPVITVTSPDANDLVTYLVDIEGSITDANLDSYRIEYARFDTDEFRLLAEGTSAIVSDVLATFDPTMLQNDQYIIRIIATDLGGNTSTYELPLEVSSQNQLGNFMLEFTDLAIPLAGIPITITRTYDSLRADELGDFGYGWQLAWRNANIRETVRQNPLEPTLGIFATYAFREGTRVYLNGPDGRRVGFTFDPTVEPGLLGDIYRPRFVADDGVFMTLSVEDMPLSKSPDGTYHFYWSGLNYNPSEYTLTTTDGTQFHYNQFDGLETVTDRNGNQLTFTDEGIFHSSGQSITFVRDDVGRITKIIDPNDNEIVYTYDGMGDLIRVVNQEGVGETYEYTADRAHYLTRVAEECGCRPWHRIEYDEDGRMISDMNAMGDSIAYSYDLENMYETVANRLGYETRIYYDARGNVIETINPEGGQVLVSYTVDDLVSSITNERGFTATFEYDANGNLTEYVDYAGQTWTWTFDAFSNPTSSTDALDRLSEMTYDADGNLTSILFADGTSISKTYDASGRILTETDELERVTTYTYTNPGDANPATITFPNELSRHAEYDLYGNVSSVIDELDNESLYFYDDAGRAIGQEDALGLQYQLIYSQSRVVERIDPRGNSTRWEYDAESRPVREIYADGTFETTVYDAAGQVVAIIDPRGITTTIEYDSLGRAIAVSRGGSTYRYEYDAVGNLIRQIDPNSHATTYEYDALDRVVRVTDALGNRLIVTYDAVGNMLTSTDAEGRVTSYSYDDVDQLISIVDAAAGVWEYEYDDAGQLVLIRDAEGRETELIYNEMGQVIEIVNPLDDSNFYDYDDAGNVIRFTDELGRETEYAYDDAFRLITTTDANEEVLTRELDGADNITAVIDRLGNRVEYTYNEVNRVTAIKDGEDFVWTFVYDANGNTIQSADPEGNVASFVYDDLERLVSQTAPDGGVTSYVYDPAGAILSVIDPLGRTTQYEYDALYRSTKTIAPNGAETSYIFDRVGNATHVVDPLGNVTEFVFDALDRVIERIDPSGNSQTFAYDQVGNLTERIDRLDRRMTFEYDDLNRVTDEIWWNGMSEVNRLEYTYDDVGNLLTAVDDFSSYTRTFDALNRLLTSSNSGTTGVPTVVLSYAYDANGNILTTSDDADTVVTSTYDGRNMVASRTWSIDTTDVAFAGFSYDDAARLVQVDRRDGNSGATLVGRSTFEYDGVGRITAISHKNGSLSPLIEYSYTWNRAGEMLSEAHHGDTTHFVYDASGQLIDAVAEAGADEAFDYDLNGNRDGVSDVVGDDNRLLEDAGFEYTYDDEGNLLTRTDKTTGDVTTFSYDHRNRLIAAVTETSGAVLLQTVEYTYDVFDRLIRKEVDGVLVRSTVYDRQHAWADFDTSGDLLSLYLQGRGIDDWVARWNETEGVTWYLSDHLHTVRDWADDTGALAGSRDYSSFGMIESESGRAVGDRFGFTGREWEGEIGLWQYRNRWMDPFTGRFTQTDPIGFSGGDDNLYRYVGNGPTWKLDPYGLTPVEYGQTLNVAKRVASGPITCDRFPMHETALKNFARLVCGCDPCGRNAGRVGAYIRACAREPLAKTSLANFANAALETELMTKLQTHRGKGRIKAEINTFKQGNGEGVRGWVTCQPTCGGGSCPTKPGIVREAPRIPKKKGNCFGAGTAIVVGIEEPTYSTTQFAVGGAVVTALITLTGYAWSKRCERKRQKTEREVMLEQCFLEYDGVNDESTDIDYAAADLAIEYRDSGLGSVKSTRPAPFDSAAADSQIAVMELESITAESDPSMNTSSLPTAVPTDVRKRSSSPANPTKWLIAGLLGTLACLVTLLTSDASHQLPRTITRSIELVTLGDRVITENPANEHDQTLGKIDPTTWQRIDLLLERDDGSHVSVSLIRPAQWIRDRCVAERDQMPLFLPEMDCVGLARIISVSPCPAISDGPGDVVTATFRHSASKIFILHVSGDSNPIRVTKSHPFWSEDRRRWIEASELRKGERLRTLRGVAQLVSVAESGSDETVFNIEVYGVHTYAVTRQGLVVHNSSASAGPSITLAHGTSRANREQILCSGLDATQARQSSRGGRACHHGGFHTHEVPPEGLPGVFVDADGWAMRHAPRGDRSVVLCTIPRPLYDELVQQGHIIVEQVVGVELPIHVVLPSAYDAINRCAMWQYLDM